MDAIKELDIKLEMSYQSESENSTKNQGFCPKYTANPTSQS